VNGTVYVSNAAGWNIGCKEDVLVRGFGALANKDFVFLSRCTGGIRAAQVALWFIHSGDVGEAFY
jgi:hypothetical protein